MTSGDMKERKREAMARVRIVGEVLRRWDPIGIRPGEFGPADEYDDYAPHIVTMVDRGCSLDELTGHLERIRTAAMGLEDGPENDARFAREILGSLRGGRDTGERA
jgi:hypothetical protein